MILRNMAPRRGVDAADFSDLTAAEQTGPAYWSTTEPGALVIPMDSEPSPDEAREIRRRLLTKDADEEQILRDLLAGARDAATPAWARALIAAELAKYGETVPNR